MIVREWNTSIVDLPDDLARQIRAWRDRGKKGDARSLLVTGPRRSGTSRVGEVAVRQARKFVSPLPGSGGRLLTERVTPDQLSDLRHSIWDTRKASDWEGALALDDEWDRIWNCPLLWIDDFHPQRSAPWFSFWKKHLALRLDTRLKEHKLTVISGSMSKKDFDSPVVEDLLVSMPLAGKVVFSGTR